MGAMDANAAGLRAEVGAGFPPFFAPLDERDSIYPLMGEMPATCQHGGVFRWNVLRKLAPPSVDGFRAEGSPPELRLVGLMWNALWTKLHCAMKTIQVVLDEQTLAVADKAAKRAKINRSALVRRAIALYAAHERERALEEQHRRGYEQHPVQPGEFDAWDAVRAWPSK